MSHRMLPTLLAVALAAACASTEPLEVTEAAGDADRYTCGMHPEVVQEMPGSCPICGMDLTPVRGPADHAPRDSAVLIDPVVVQNMGVRVAHVERGRVTRMVRAPGVVEHAEDTVSVVNLRFSGWVERLRVDQTGQEVRRGETLFDIYSPEVVAAQDELLLALRSEDGAGSRVRAVKDRLRNWQVPESVVSAAMREGTAQRLVPVLAPRRGRVLHKQILEGARVNAGDDLYRIGDLSRVWVRAQIYEDDAPWVGIGSEARVETPSSASKEQIGEVSFIYPTVDSRTRVVEVRTTFENEALSLKPGALTTIRIAAQERTRVLRIPSEAVLRTGERTFVFVSREVGRYEPREIETGLVGEDVVEVVKGLDEGEFVVTSGQFLLDSESRLQEATNKLLEARLEVPRNSSDRVERSSP